MKNDLSFFISRYVGWLKSTEVWQRMVVRATKRRGVFLLYGIVVFGMLGWGQMLIDVRRPILRLEEMETHTGILASADRSGKYRNEPWFSLRLADGQIMTYSGIPGTTDRLKQLIGQHMSVWSQDQLEIIRFGYQKQAFQILSRDELIVDYASTRSRMDRFKEAPMKDFWFVILGVIPTLMIVLPLLALWRACRKPVEPNLSTKLTSKE